MKTTIPNLRRIIRKVIKEGWNKGMTTILNLASRPEGVKIEELIAKFGENYVYDTIDELEESGLLYMEDDGTYRSDRGY